MLNICVNSDGKVVMYSNGFPEPPSGGYLHTLTPEQETVFTSLIASGNNSGLMFDGTNFTEIPKLVPPKVASCTPLQFRMELRARNLFNEVTALVAASSVEAQDAYEYATAFESNNPLLLALAAQLSTPLNADQVYDMILSASTKQVGMS